MVPAASLNLNPRSRNAESDRDYSRLSLQVAILVCASSSAGTAFSDKVSACIAELEDFAKDFGVLSLTHWLDMFTYDTFTVLSTVMLPVSEEPIDRVTHSV
jgi:hypothetical protein